MDSTSASVVYANSFYAPNYSDTQQPQPQLQSQHQMFHASYMVRSPLGSGLGFGLGPAPNPQASTSSGLSPRSMYGDLYRFEDGSGDASGSLLLGQEDDHFCGEEADQQVVASTSSSCPTSPTSGESVSMDTEPEPEGSLQMNQGELVEREEMNGLEEMEELAEGTDQQRLPQSPCMGGNTSYMVFPRTAADYMPRLPLPRHCPYINIGQEQYVIQAETVFVLGMRLNVTKNDIILFFGKLGVIKMDESTNKPKIFVYKNKMTGRSKGEATITYVSPFSAQAAISCLSGAKFMGQVLTVLPAYLSTRRGSVRYSYPRELNSPELQRRQRVLKWKPASDNWVCILCRNSNFVWRSSCNRCQADKVVALQNNGPSSWTGSGGGAGSPRRWRPQRNDWLCKLCFNMNFWYRVKCNRCHASRPDETNSSESSSEEEDTWELVLNPSCAE